MKSWKCFILAGIGGISFVTGLMGFVYCLVYLLNKYEKAGFALFIFLCFCLAFIIGAVFYYACKPKED